MNTVRGRPGKFNPEKMKENFKIQRYYKEQEQNCFEDTRYLEYYSARAGK